MDPKTHRLKNGLNVIFADTGSPSLTTVLMVGAGSRYENPVNNGVAHFFEHMAFKGSLKYPNSFVISSTIEALGGIFNAFTSKDHTAYWIKSTSDHFPTVIDVISDMVLHPLLDPAEIEREKGVIREEINMYEDTPQRRVGELFESFLYGGNPLGFDIAGTKETVSAFDRKTFREYIDSLYYPGNSVLVLSGGFKGRESEYLKTIGEKFSVWKDGKTLRYKKIKELQSKPGLIVKYKKTEQSHLCLGFRAFSFFDRKKYAMNVLSVILGGGMSSRLFIQVRERKGLCYYISSGAELYGDAGNFVTQAGITNEITKIREAVKVILDEHKKIADVKVQDSEIKKAKEMIRGRLLLSMEDSASVASFYGTKKLLQGEIQTVGEVIKEIENVSETDVKDLAKQLFVPEKLNFALIGPYREEDFANVLEI